MDLTDILILKQLNEDESSSKGFNINEFYTPFLVMLIIYYLLNNKSNLCSNCACNLAAVTPTYRPPPPINMQPLDYKYFNQLEYNPY